MLANQKKIIFGASILFLLISIIMAAWGFPKIVSKQIQRNIEISNTSKMFDKFVKIPMPLDFKIYVFNVTNRDDINQGKKPILNQIGPFVYKQYRDRTILGYGPNDTVKYMLNKHFFFDKEASGDLTDDLELTVINFSYMGAVLSTNEIMPAFVGIVNKALEQFFTNLTDPFMTVKVKDLFFDGIFLNCDGDNSALGLVCGRIKAEKPKTMRIAEDANGFYFSLFAHMNNTPSGPYEMIRGTEDLHNLGRIVSYEGESAGARWGDAYCDMINGSDATVFPPVQSGKEPKRLYTFEPDLCRSMYASYAGMSSIFNMTTAYYEVDETVLAAKSANPNNKCFCRKNWSANHDGCLIMGVLNLLPCQGAPAIVSFPHFYLASEELLEFFESGVSPDKNLHNNYVHIEPLTGVVLKGVRRLQFNIELRNMPNIPQLQSVPTGLFPLLWIEEGAEIPTNLQDELKHSHKLVSYAGIGRWLLLTLAIFICIISGAVYAKAASIWPNNNSVSFILRPGTVNKGLQ